MNYELTNKELQIKLITNELQVNYEWITKSQMEIHVNELHHNVIMFCGGICDNNQNMKEKKGVKKGGGGQVR